MGAAFFQIPFAVLYVADSGGSANSTEIGEVQTAIAALQAFGVNITVLSGTPVTINWTATVVLDPDGPNYAALSTSTALIVASMKAYIVNLPTGTSFVRATANAAMLAIWGSGGTGDITTFTTSIPSSDTAMSGAQKAIPGTVATI